MTSFSLFPYWIIEEVLILPLDSGISGTPPVVVVITLLSVPPTLVNISPVVSVTRVWYVVRIVVLIVRILLVVRDVPVRVILSHHVTNKFTAQQYD
jgi:hypothetical protein